MNSFTELLTENRLSLTPAQSEQFEMYFRLLVEWNEKMNLTAITEREQVYIKHFYDSITPAFTFDMSTVHTVADIGSGAGFPSIPLKIMFPHLQVTIIDSLQKRIHFLQQLIGELCLTDVQAIHGRAEDLGRVPAYRDHFDLVTARAVARLSVLCEFCLPFVNKNGTFIAMKGSAAEEELHEAQFAIKQLNGSLIGVHKLELPGDQAERNLIEIRKIGGTPGKYPRKAGVPLKSPLLPSQAHQ